MNNHMKEFSWVGSQEDFVDRQNITYVNHIIVGRYGGNSNAGQYKNEDGCLVWLNEKEDWEFVIVLDAHNTAESAEKVLGLFEDGKAQIKPLLSMAASQKTFKMLEENIISMFQSKKFLSICQKTQGETACLIVVRKDKYIWWFSVGDCVLYLFHPELSSLGQYQLNQRQFYEWIGQVNTFEQEVPCYSVGIRELRQGENHLLLTTDGLLECPNEPYSNPQNIYHAFASSKEEESMKTLFRCIEENNVRDNTTIISWKTSILKKVTLPSDQT
ncbi:protein phosphatase 2C domain-containing protein [Cytobacillus kochii]|uniref:Protein phosphatase n=1 Tax=Cytobacillus kochii TaxID=859143 RepID=A0A248TKD9_9BACI|nr:protein phosphatase 2C domain-containing protein [Cytobacillus kochii]ASV68676.1 protein phosphatase [Cytobacillus kochii]